MKKIKSVIGLGFGDEGKGLTIDYLTNKSKNPLIIRHSGGQQAGHNVVIGDNNHIFSTFGSGTLRGAPTYWSKYCTVDPVSIINELNHLTELNIKPLLYIDGDSPITTPYDKLHNRTSKKDLNHGTVGAGVGSTISREELLSFTFSDIFYPWIIDIKLENIKNYYKFELSENEINEFIESIYTIIENKDIFKLTYGIPKEYSKNGIYQNIIFESSQGLLLDQHFGFFPHVARTDTGTKNIINILKNNDLNYNDIELFLITRSYQTRHGNGPMSNTNYDIDINNINETNQTNEFQGEFRKSILDVSLLEYAINKDEYIRNSKNKNLVITCLDHLTEYVFTYNDELKYFTNEKDFIDEISKILKIKNIYISKSSNSEKIKKYE
jgi:adenylosuccinate synthase